MVKFYVNLRTLQGYVKGRASKQCGFCIGSKSAHHVPANQLFLWKTASTIPQKKDKKNSSSGGTGLFFCYTMCVTALPVVSGVRYECL